MGWDPVPVELRTGPRPAHHRFRRQLRVGDVRDLRARRADDPFRLLTNRTTLSGYVWTGLHGLIISAALFYLLVYFQACKDSSPVGSGVNVLPYSLSIAPFAIVAGGTATGMNKYKPQNAIAWACIMVGMGLQSTLHAVSATRNWIGLGMLVAEGY